MAHYLIIGNGAAGVSAAEAIRRRDTGGQITILTDEPYPLYSRPGIAYFILDQVSEKQILSRNQSFYERHRFDLRVDRVVRLDVTRQIAYLESGPAINYDVALLATGASATPPSFPGKELDGVLTFDTLADAKDLVRRARRAKSSVVVGGGITAMELVEGLQHQGTRAHLLQRRDRIWPRLFNPTESAIIEHQVKHEGIHIHYHEEIEAVIGRKGKVAAVQLKSGRELKCQVVGVAIGVRPNIGLVKDAPVDKDRGVMVNEFLQSSRRSLFAAGDVAQVYDRWTEGHHLDILWPSAINEGRAAGHNMVDVAHGRTPGFSYQKGSPFNAALLFGIHLTVIGQVGNSDQNEEVVVADELSRGSSFVWSAPFRSRTLSAWDSHGPNSARIIMAEGRIIGALLLGNQLLADPLRYLVEKEVDVSAYSDRLLNAGPQLAAVLAEVWRNLGR